MIAYLEGTLLHRDEESCLILTNAGVGYTIFLHPAGQSTLPAEGEEVKLFTYTLVREDALTLFGFASWEERQTFLTLLGAPKLGPKTALAMLGCYSPSDLAGFIATEDSAALSRIPGIGAKTAKRLILDLKDKLRAPLHTTQPGAAPKTSASADCTAALLALGYSQQEIQDTVHHIFEQEPDIDTSSAIRQALKRLSTR